MKRKSTRTSSAVDIYKDALEKKGLLKMAGSKRFDEFLEEVYTSLRREKESEKFENKKKNKSLSDSDIVVGKCPGEEKKIKNELKYNVEENYYNNGYIQSVRHNQKEEYSQVKEVDIQSLYNLREGENFYKKKRSEDNKEEDLDILKYKKFKENLYSQKKFEENFKDIFFNQKRPEENFYNNGYIQSVAHRDSPPCTNRTELTANVLDCGYKKETTTLKTKYSYNDLYTKREEERPKSCAPPVAEREEVYKRPHSCDPRSIFGFPRIYKPRMDKKEVDLRIQAALGLLKLKHLY